MIVNTIERLWQIGHQVLSDPGSRLHSSHSSKEGTMRTSRGCYGLLLIASLTFLAGVLLGIRWSAGWGIFILGVGVLEIAGFSLRWRSQFLKRAYHADGIVIAHKRDPSGEEGWFPIVRYTLPDGQEITFQSRSSTFRSRKSLPVSTPVGVLYDPNKPEYAIINSPLEKFGGYFLGLFAIALMVLGILILVGLIPR
jgi:Protein of unknown function (DUF3592)